MKRTIETSSAALLAAIALAGCEYKFPAAKPTELAAPENSEIRHAPYADLEKELLNEPGAVDDETTASDIAARLSEKYGKAVEEIKKLQDEHNEAIDKDRTSQARIVKLQTDLARAERELTEANAMLLEMREELKQWKRDVLGFRSEMRQSQKAMLDAVTRLTVVISGGVGVDDAAASGSPATRPAPIASNLNR